MEPQLSKFLGTRGSHKSVKSISLELCNRIKNILKISTLSTALIDSHCSNRAVISAVRLTKNPDKRGPDTEVPL